MSRRRVVVTGGSGFIGSHVVDKLVAAGYAVTVVDPAPPHRSDVEHAPVDIMDLEALAPVFAGAEAVFHLAAIADVNVAAADPVRAVELTVVGTTNVWEAARRQGVKRAVLASTVWVYGAAPGGPPLSEGATFSPADVAHVYTATKLACEMVVHSYHALWQQEYTILRYGIPYGPRMRPALVIPRFVGQALDATPITLHGDGSQSRNYVYVEDLADAHVLALGAAGANEVFNLEGLEEVSLRRILELLAELLESEVDVTYLPARPGDYDGREVSGEHAATLLGWRPSTRFRVGLRAYVDWHRASAAVAEQVPATQRAVASDHAAVARRLSLAERAQRAAPLAIAAIGVGWPAAAGDADGAASRLSWGVVAFAAVVLAWVLAARRPAGRGGAVVGAAMVVVAMWMLPQSSPAATYLVLSAEAGLGLGLLLGAPRRSTILALGAGGAVGGLWPHAAVPLVLVPVVFSALLVATRTAEPLPTARARRWPALMAGFLAFATVWWVGTVSASAWWFAPFDTWNHGNGDRVAITFNTGPSDLTIRVADLLHASGVQATFFVNGPAATAHPDVLEALHDEGHLIANGTTDQGAGASLGLSVQGVLHTRDAIAAAIGECPRFVRPARSRKTPWLSWQLHRRDMVMVLGDVDPRDQHAQDATALADSVLDRTKPGSIIVLHDGGFSDAHGQVLLAALPLVLQGLAERGLTPVRLDELLDQHGTLNSCH